MRPKPLIPILTDTQVSLFLVRCTQLFSMREARGFLAERASRRAVARRDATRLRQYQQAVRLLAGDLEALGDVLPVRDVPRGLDVVGLHVEVVEVEGVLPHVELEQRHGALRGVRLLVEQLLDDEARADRVPAEHRPAGALDSGGRGGEVRLELLERAEVLIDRGLQLALGLTSAVRRQVGPEDRVVDVTAEVE